jgi:molybdopterin-guanine dinucleotide biosynthesis protein A
MLGAVLAGGDSRRFGTDKARAHLAGETLLERAAATLARVFQDVIVVSSRDQPTAPWPRVPDARAGGGPLAGIEAALLRARDLGFPGVFVLACDLPLVDESTIRSVVTALGDHAAAAAAPDDGSELQPLCAAYRVECLAAVTGALDAGRLAAHRVFESMQGVRVSLPAARLLNVNTPGDHARAVAVVEGRPDGLPNSARPAHVSTPHQPSTEERPDR